jgi:hypothetical protein
MQKDEQGAEAIDKSRVEFSGEPTSETGEKKIAEPTVEEIKAKIAEKVRADSREHAAVTPSEVVFALVPGSQQGRITAILDEMTADDRYPDIKAVTTASGMVFFVSKTFIDTDEAIAKSRIEEVKSLFAEKVRADSRDDVVLSPTVDLHALAPEMEPAGIAAILDAMRTDARYADVKTVTASNGDVYFYSEKHMSGYYALVLSRVAAKDPCATIAAMVRDDSRIYPRPTCVQLFMGKPFDIPPRDLKTVVEETLKKPEFGDIKMIVHPSTGGIYLYSTLYLDEGNASRRMDWQEVGRDANP